MGEFSSHVRAVSADLIARYGRDAVYLRVVSSTFSPSTSSTTRTTATVTVKVVVGDPNEDGFDPDDVTRSRSVDLYLAAEDEHGQALGFEPAAGDSVTFGGRTYTVVSVNSVAVQDTHAVHVLRARF